MFIVDTIVTSPFRAILAIFREIHNAAKQEAGNEAATIRTELGELYMLLEMKSITEDEFDKRESALLDRLDALEDRQTEQEENDRSP
jgi:Gas vesicle protein G